MDQSGSKADEQNGDNADGGELTTTSLVKKDVEKVIVHPLVLLSVVDHYNRMRKVGHSRYVCIQIRCIPLIKLRDLCSISREEICRTYFLKFP